MRALGWLVATAHGVYWHQWPGWAHGFTLGLIAGALARGRRGKERVEENYVLVAAVLLGAGIAWGLVVAERPFTLGWLLLTGARHPPTGLVGHPSLPTLLRTDAASPLLWISYSVRGRGPGLASFPSTGPCLVIANHACWLDPIFLAKVLPRPITPMMTARFYDQPVIRRLVTAFGVIRVPEKAMKKDAPEIGEAIAALDRGECVVIFPEGYLRRIEERLLRRFGQGNLADTTSAAGHAGVCVLDRGRVGELHVVLQWPTDEEQEEGLAGVRSASRSQRRRQSRPMFWPTIYRRGSI